jgi:hypothetical protein
VVEYVLDWAQRNNSSADLERICGLQIHDQPLALFRKLPDRIVLHRANARPRAPRIGSRIGIWLRRCGVQLELDQT